MINRAQIVLSFDPSFGSKTFRGQEGGVLLRCSENLQRADAKIGVVRSIWSPQRRSASVAKRARRALLITRAELVRYLYRNGLLSNISKTGLKDGVSTYHIRSVFSRFALPWRTIWWFIRHISGVHHYFQLSTISASASSSAKN